MSQAYKHVEWCIKKAKKEIEESKNLGKSPKHKGLLEIKPSTEEAKKHILKAEHNLKAVAKFKEIGFSDWSIAAVFYSIYHCFLAIAFKFGYESKNQTCTIALIEYLQENGKINIDKKFIDILKYSDMGIDISKVIEMREEYTYGVDIAFDDTTKIEDLIKTCKDIIFITKNIIYK